MKARFLALAALVLGMVSCQQDFDGVAPVGGEVDFQLTVAAPELGATRADGDERNGHDSAYGAIDYLSEEDWANVDLRYTLEVYDVDEDGKVLSSVPVKDRMTQVVEKYTPVSFDLRLVPNRKYRFVVFADFVDADGNGKHHKIGETLQDITVVEDGINNEYTDAYFDFEDITISNSVAHDIVLRRPYGKVRVIATDLAELNLNVNPGNVVVEYEAAHVTGFNAVTGEIDTTNVWTSNSYDCKYADSVSKETLADHYYTEGYDAETVTVNGVVRHTHMTLFTDYILATDEQSSIHFTMTVNDKGGKEIKTTQFYTDIPVQRNHLTTIIGNVLTTATEINVTIDDNFANEYTYQLWDGKSIKEPKMEGEFYVIYEAAELAWLADQVNNKGKKFNGKTFKLGKNIHLNHELWTPIGATGKFEGTFDGNYEGVDHQIEGVFVSVKGKAAAGLFANAKYVRNLTVLNSQIYGQYKTGVIVGDGLCSRIDNCHVDGCEVLVTPYNKDEANNVGGIVGYLSAENEAWVKGCSVKNTKITAYRKVGGIAGAANQAAVVTGNSVENVSVFADMTADYNEVKAADAGAIVGYVHSKATVENNTTGKDVSVVVYIDADAEHEYYAKKSERVHVTFKAGEYNFTKGLEVYGAIQANLGGEVVLNVNGQTITTGTNEDYGFIAKGEGNELVINEAVVVSNGGGIAATDGAKLEFNGNSVAVNTTNTSARYNIYTANGGEVVINGGTFSFKNTSGRRAYVYANAGTRVVINGGVFGKASTRSGYKEGILGTGEVIIYGGTFGFDPSNWLADGYFTVKEGANWVVKAPVVVNNESELADAVANAVEGSKIILADNANYGTIAAGALKNVTIEGGNNTVMTFTTDATSALENVTLKNVDFVYDGSNANSGIVIAAQATIKNLVIDGCSFVGTGAKAGRGISGNNNNATIEVKNCSFSNIGYPIYGWGGYESLTISGCTFENIVSWAIMPQSGFDGNLTVTNNQFSYCKGGLVKAGTLTAGHTFTFTGNVVTNAEPHPNRNWFEFNVSAGNAVISDNTMDGDAWTPGSAEGLK